MAISQELQQKLTSLKASIKQFMALHKNPHDTSQYDALAEKMQKMETYLATATGEGDNTPTTTKTIQASVGKGGTNNKADVQLVQELLNKKGNSLTEDGKYGTKTLNAIQAFQRSIGNNNPDGLIEPNKNTWKALSSGDGNDDTGNSTGDTDTGNLTTLKGEVEQTRAGAKAALATVEDLNAAQITIEDSEKAKVEAYVAKAKEFLDAYEAAAATEKSAFDQSNSGYVDEIKQSYEWNANSFLPKTNGGTDGSTGTGDVTISDSVGQGGANKNVDVKKIQELLNKKGGKLTVDGKIGDKTIEAIRSFQRSVSIGADGLISPGKNTLKKLNGTGGKVTEEETPSGGYSKPTGSYKYFNHNNWENVRATLQPGSRTAKKLNATAERLLRSIIAGAGVSSTIITSTKRNYTDQAYILLTQVTRAEAYKWYGHVNRYSTQFEKYRRDLRNGRDRETVFREYGAFIQRNVGLAASNHLSGIAIDISGPNYQRVERFAKTLVPIAGSGVKRVFPEAGRSHIEFTFQVT